MVSNFSRAPISAPCVCHTLSRRVLVKCRGVEQACKAPLNKAPCSVLRISLETSSDVPARSDLKIPNGPCFYNYNKILAFATVLHPQTLRVPSSLSIYRFGVGQFGSLEFWKFDNFYSPWFLRLLLRLARGKPQPNQHAFL